MTDETVLGEWLDAWRAGDQGAAAKIFDRYAQRLVDFVERRMSPHLRQRVGSDDIMLSVLHCILQGVAIGKYSMDGKQTLWQLVSRVAVTKIQKYAEHHNADRRRMSVETRELEGAEPVIADSAAQDPVTVAAFADQLDQIRARLKPAQFRILELYLQGLTYIEIADELGISLRTVQYKMNRIRENLGRGGQVEEDEISKILACSFSEKPLNKQEDGP